MKTFSKISTMAFGFLITEIVAAGTPMVRIQLKGYANTSDETVVYYQIGAGLNFDPNYDAYKLPVPNPAPQISQQCANTLLAINGIAPVTRSSTLAILVRTPITAGFTISASDFADLPTGTCVYLKDRFTGALTNLLSSAVSFTLYDSTSCARFILCISYGKPAVFSSVYLPGCKGPTSGKIKASVDEGGDWNVIWRDSLSRIIQSGTLTSGWDSLDGLIRGRYGLTVLSNMNPGYRFDTNYVIQGIKLPGVAFTAPDTIIASKKVNYAPVNNSYACVQYTWNFGDQSASSTMSVGIHVYELPGLFRVKLSGKSVSSCIDTISRTLRVVDGSISIIDKGNKKFGLKGAKNISNLELEVASFSNLSQKQRIKIQNTSEEEKQFALSELDSGIYVFNVYSKGMLIHSVKKLLQ